MEIDKYLKPKVNKKVKVSLKEMSDKLEKLNFENIFYIYSKTISRTIESDILQQIYKLKILNSILEDVKEEGLDYKYIIRIRFDFLPINKIKLTENRSNKFIQYPIRDIEKKNLKFDID